MSRHVSLGWSLGFAGVVGVLVATTSGAQSVPVVIPPPGINEASPVAASTTVSVSTNVQDFSQGFRAFIRMGLPDTSKAKYVNLTYHSMGDSHSMLYGLQELGMLGNAWLVTDNKDDKSVLVSSTGRTLELFEQQAMMKKQAAEARSNAVSKATASGKGGDKPRSVNPFQAMADWSSMGTWRPVDLGRDLAKATEFVNKKIKAKSAGGREMSYDSFSSSDAGAGQLFMFATFAWQNGKVQEANELVGRLFTLMGDSRKVIVGAMNILADSQLTSASAAFRKTGDWQAYSDAVAALLKKYPAGWRQAGAAKMLSDRLIARAALTEPPAIVGEGLDAEDQKLAAALVTATNIPANYYGHGLMWVFPAGPEMRMMKDESVAGLIKARGVKSIPLLIAMASDETLCPYRRSDVGLPQSYTSFDQRTPDEERTRKQYAQMDRPLTRGEFARGLLTPLCPRQENNRHGQEEVAPEELTESAKQVYATIKGMTPIAMAQHFMKNGDPNQAQNAIGYLLQNDCESNAPAIEAYLLTPPTDENIRFGMSMGHGMAQQYVQKRGEKAAEFVEKYIAMRKKIELPANMADNASYVKMMEKQAENEFKTLRALVKKADLSSIVAEVANPAVGPEGAMNMYSLLEQVSPTEAVPAFLAAAVNTTNVAVRVRILQTMHSLRYVGRQKQMEAAMAAAASDPEAMEEVTKKMAEGNKLEIGTNAANWKILLEDTRPASAAKGHGIYGMGRDTLYTVADSAAGAIEALYATVNPAEQHGRMWGGGTLSQDVMMKITRARAAARLEGKPDDQLPKFPSSDDVTAERRKLIEADIVKATPATLQAVLEKLTDAESCYLAEAVRENESIMKALAPLSRRIAEVKVDPALPAADAARLQKWVGATVSSNVIMEMQDCCKRQLAGGKALSVTLTPGGLGKGLSLNVTPLDPATGKMYGAGYVTMLTGKGSKRKGMVTGSLMNGQTHGNCSWLVDLPAPAAVTGTVVAADAEADDKLDTQLKYFERSLSNQQDQFDSAVDAFCQSPEMIGAGSMVTFIGIIPPNPKDKKEGDEEDPFGGVIDIE